MAFGGAMPTMRSFEDSRVVILPVPVDRTTSYVSGTRNGPREILEASSHMELWDEEVGADVHGVGIFTLPAMELPFGEMAPLMDEIRARGRQRSSARDKFLVTLGGEHSITPPLVAAAAARYQRAVGAADRRARRSARLLHGHAAQPRLRDAPEPRVRARDAGRHPQHVDRGGGGGAGR